MSTNHLTAVQAARSAQRQRFAEFITPHIDAHGGPAEVAAMLGMKLPDSVAAWVAAEKTPGTPRLLAMAAAFGINPHVLLDVAGKPPIVELRHAMADDHAASLPGLLAGFRARTGFTAQQAADHFGLHLTRYAKLSSGSLRPDSVYTADLVARGLGLTVPDVLDAAAVGANSPLRAEYEAGTTGAAGMIRATVEAAGIRSWAPQGLRQGAKLLAIPVTRMRDYLAGRRTPDLLDCQRIANAGVHTLVELLEASGYEPVDAARLAEAVAEARNAGLSRKQTRRRDSYVSVGELVKAYRITAGLSQDDVASRIGFQRTAVTKVELGETAGSLELQLELCEALGVPLPRMLVSAGLVL